MEKEDLTRLQNDIASLQTRLRENEMDMVAAKLALQQAHKDYDELKAQINKSEERFKTGVGRIIWLVGGGLISGILAWIMKGGLNNVG